MGDAGRTEEAGEGDIGQDPFIQRFPEHSTFEETEEVVSLQNSDTLGRQDAPMNWYQLSWWLSIA